MEFVVYSFLNVSLLFFMYHTDAFVEYVKLFRLNKLFEIDNYEGYLDTYSGGNYWDFLVFQKRTFLRKLLSCPYCLSFWLNVAATYFHKEIVYFIFNLWFTLLLYLVLKVLLKKSEE